MIRQILLVPHTHHDVGYTNSPARLERRADYPYEVAVVHAANDNRWPTPLHLDVVRHWNTARPELPMRTATIDEALDLLEKQARETDIPVVRGEWSDWWSHGHGSTAREVAVYREARSFALAAQASLGLALLRGAARPATAHVIGYRRGPVRLRSEAEIVADLARVDEDLLLFGEHTWGSWETYAKPHSTFSHSHWNAKAGFAYAAYDLARDLAVEGMFRLAAPVGSGAPAEGVLVVNPTRSPLRSASRSSCWRPPVRSTRRRPSSCRTPAGTGSPSSTRWASPMARTACCGAVSTRRWSRSAASTPVSGHGGSTRGGHVNSWLMNNLHFTNFQARQDGTRRYRYRFTAGEAAVTRERVRTFGRDLLEPLQARQYRGPVQAGGRGLRVTPPDRLHAEVRPVGDGAVRVRLRNIAAEPVDATVHWDGPAGQQRETVRVQGHDVADVILRRPT